MVKRVEAIEDAAVKQAVHPVEPGIVEHDRDQQHQRSGPPGEFQRYQRPALLLREQPEGEADREREDRDRRLPQFLPFTPVDPVLLDAALGMAGIHDLEEQPGQQHDRNDCPDHEAEKAKKIEQQRHHQTLFRSPAAGTTTSTLD